VVCSSNHARARRMAEQNYIRGRLAHEKGEQRGDDTKGRAAESGQ
jgi:hypothetical protein